MVDINNVLVEFASLVHNATGLSSRITSVGSDGVLQVTSAAEGTVTEYNFLPSSHRCTTVERTRLFLRYKYSHGCQLYVYALADALRLMCDENVPLRDGSTGKPITNIVVLNSVQFDLSDIPPGDRLRLRDPLSGVEISALSTHANLSRQGDVPAHVLRRFRKCPPDPEGDAQHAMRQHAPDKYMNTCPHWWVGIVVNDEYIIHADICGAAYDYAKALKTDSKGRAVSMQTFVTPLYQMVHNHELPHKFFFTPTVTLPPGKLRPTDIQAPVVTQPWSVRHFRTMCDPVTSFVEVTPLRTFLDRNNGMDVQLWRPGDEWNRELVSLRYDLIRTGLPVARPANVAVTVQNLEKRPDLNGRTAHVVNSGTAVHAERIAVQIVGENAPMLIRPECIQLKAIQQYRTLDEMKAVFDEKMRCEAVGDSKCGDMKSTFDSLSKAEQRKVRHILKHDADVRKVMGLIRSGSLLFSCFTDRGVVRGTKKLLKPPLSKLGLIPDVDAYTVAVEVASREQAREVFELMAMVKTEKTKLMEERSEDLGLYGGHLTVPLVQGTKYQRMLELVAKKVDGDPELNDMFNQLHQVRLYNHPMRQYELSQFGK